MDSVSYVLCTGWWCVPGDADTRARRYGSDFIRAEQFHRLWYDAVCRFTAPRKILIVDSASPVPPPFCSSDPRVEYLRLAVNAGHATAHTGKYCGYTRAILVALEYAAHCDVEYFVYLEQDALIFGEGILERCIDEMRTDYSFGHPSGTPQRLQQSLFIVRVSAIRRFLRRLHAIEQRDGDLSPEAKFHIACSRGPVKALVQLQLLASSYPLAWRWTWGLFTRLRDYDWLPVGYGRTRPLKFDDDMFYFQHGSDEEIDTFVRRSGL
jgi:hypothetical protein